MRIGAAWTYVRSELRRRWVSLLALTLFVVVGTGVGVGALVLAERTDSAYPDYVRTADVNRLVVNPSLASNAVDAAMRTLPGVTSVHTNDLLLATVVNPEGGRFGDISTDVREAWLQVRGSPDGEYVDVDRPVVTEGRLPSGEHEMFVGADYRDTLEQNLGRSLSVGDQVDMGFIATQYAVNPDWLDPDATVRPLAVERLTLVGFGHSSSEVLPDDLWPREQILVSGDVATRYQCHYDLTPETTMEQLTVDFIDDCSTAYRYYSLGLEPGTTLDDVREAFGAVADELSADLSPDAQELGVGYFPISQDRTILDDAVSRTTTPVVWALTAFGVVAALATVVIALLVTVRAVRRADPDQRSLLALGAGATTRAAAAGGAPLLALLVGALGGLVVAGLVSLAGPVGSVSRLEPSPGLSLPFRVVGPALAVIVGLLVIGTLLVSFRAVRRAPRVRGEGERTLPGWLGRTATSRPWAAVGIRAAFGERRSDTSGAVLAGSAVAVLVTAAAVVFGANLAAVADSPARYGWPWEATVITGSGYSDTDVSEVEATFADHPEILSTDYYAFDPAAQVQATGAPEGVEGVAVPTVFAFAGAPCRQEQEGERTEARQEGVEAVSTAAADGGGGETEGQDDEPCPRSDENPYARAGESPLAVVEGRATQGPGEVLLGTRTAKELGVGIGDHITIATYNLPSAPGAIEAEVVGTAVMPAVGPFVADRSGLGEGAFLPVDIPPTGMGQDVKPAAMVAIRLADGTDPSAFVASVAPSVATWSKQEGLPILLDHPVHPPEIIDITDMRGAPLLLALILAAALAIGLALSIAVSVRDRQRDLAVLRVLGLRGRELRSTVRWQALTTTAVGLVVGLPVGIVLGRLAWRRFADELGLVPRADIPWTWLVGIVVAAVVLGLLAALVPGRYAARVRPAAILRRQ